MALGASCRYQNMLKPVKWLLYPIRKEIAPQKRIADGRRKTVKMKNGFNEHDPSQIWFNMACLSERSMVLCQNGCVLLLIKEWELFIDQML